MVTSSRRQMRAYPKVPELCERLQQIALQHQPHERLPGVSELCTLLGTSSGTLNEVLGHLEEQGVLYRKVGRGIFVSPELFRIRIGLLFASPWLSTAGSSSFWGMLLESFTRIAQQRSQCNEDHLLHLLSPDSEKKGTLPKEFKRQVEARRVHGVLGVSLSHEDLQWLTDQQIPSVLFAGYGPHTVGLDEQMLIRLALAKLLEQGCRRIGLWGISPSADIDDPESGLSTFRQSIIEAGLPFDPALIQPVPEHARTLHETRQGSLIAEQVFSAASSLPRPDGVIVVRDLMTEGALVTLPALGVRIGEDLQIATHGNVGTTLLFDIIPGVTVVEFDPMRIAATMFDLLDQVRTGQPVAQITLVPPQYRQVAQHL